MNKKKRWPFASKVSKENSLCVQPGKQSPTDGPSWTLYQTCNKLNLEVFLDCLYDNYLAGLTLKGNPTEEALKAQWQKLYIEYCMLLQDTSYNEVFELTKTINTLYAQMTLIDACVQHLLNEYDLEIVEMLNHFQLRCDVTEADTEEILIKKLKGVIGRAKKWLVDVQVAEAELELIQDKEVNSTPRSYFYDTLLTISKHFGYHMKSSEITVYEFVSSIKKLNEHYQRELGLGANK